MWCYLHLRLSCMYRDILYYIAWKLSKYSIWHLPKTRSAQVFTKTVGSSCIDAFLLLQQQTCKYGTSIPKITFVRRLWINDCFPWYFMIWYWCQYIRLSAVAIIALQTHNYKPQHHGDFDCYSLSAGLGGNGEFERKLEEMDSTRGREGVC